ncbi:flagellar hook protein [Chromatium okenii]|uniref:flagellar filament capping protein FliD n=1 Tax=Chromatium okenii TaxID=61644 RepID=UPI0019032C83|nr:flagellar filament capping protein FliD [Chromatium okenii]MBK1641930.1 flagellar hook protein [Chromatium okenii]
MDTNIVSTLGAGSGIDIKNLVTQLTAIERAPRQDRIDTKQKTYDAQISGYGKLKSALDTLKTAIGELGNTSLFNARTVNVPDSEAITANKVSAGAQIGNYSIDVLKVASAQSLATEAQDERDSALNATGTMTINFGAWTYSSVNPADPLDTSDPLDQPAFTANTEREALSIAVTATDSLDSIAAKINEADAGVQASVLKVDDKYQLLLTAPSGEKNALQVSVSDPSLNGFSFTKDNHAEVTQTQRASDAQVKVNGLTVTREDNTMDDVITGLNFTVNNISTASLNFSITADKDSAKESVQDFVAAYNVFQKTSHDLVSYYRDEDNNLVRGELAGDISARSMIDQLRTLIGGAVPGLASGGFTALTNVGIRTERDGSLTINNTEFNDAFTNHFNLVGELFASKATSANSAVTVNQGTFASSAVAGNYEVAITRDPTQGQTVGNAVTDVFPKTIASGDGYTFKMNVDGVFSNSIELTGTYASVEELRLGLQLSINSDSKLKAAGVGVDVGFDTVNNQFSFKSREYGTISQAIFSEAGAGMANLGITPTQAKIVGAALTEATFDSGTDTFTSPLDATTKDYTFQIKVDGLESSSITLTNTYNSAADVAAELELKINADSTLSTAGAAIDVEYDTVNNRFTFNSRAGGTVSAIEFSTVSDDMAAFGISTTMGGTRGIDVAGTVNGVEGFGAGNVLLPDVDSDAYGLNFSVRAGAKAESGDGFEVGFSRGMAGEFLNLVEQFLSSNGVIKTRESSIQTQLDKLDEDTSNLDRRMEGVSARLLAQFTTMERIVASFQDTSSQLDGLVDRLPFTASND